MSTNHVNTKIKFHVNKFHQLFEFRPHGSSFKFLIQSKIRGREIQCKFPYDIRNFRMDRAKFFTPNILKFCFISRKLNVLTVIKHLREGK